MSNLIKRFAYLFSAIALVSASVSAADLQSKTEKFTLRNIENEFKDIIAGEIETHDFIGLKNVFLNKVGSNKKFSLSQVQTSGIDDEYLVRDFKVDEIKKSFSANIKHSTKDIEIEVNGKFSEMIELPVLEKSLTKNSIITEADLKLEKFDKAQLRQQAITSTDKVVGKRLTRTVSSDRMISFKDIEEPTVINKGTVATLIYKFRNMELKTIAEAMEPGAEGQIIRFKNIGTDKTVTAMVNKNGTAVVNYSNIAELADNNQLGAKKQKEVN